MELLGPFTIAAGETKVFHKQARYLEVIKASADLDILMLGPSGEAMDEMRGALSGFYAEAPFVQLQVKNRAATAQVVTLMVTDGRGGSRRQPGTVEVIDASQRYSITGAAFMARYAIFAGAGNMPGMQINCKAGAAQSIYIQKIVFSSTLAGAARMGFVTPNAGSTQIQAKNGTLLDTLQFSADNFQGAVGLLISNGLGNLEVQASVEKTIDLKAPIVVAPGTAFGVSIDVATATVRGYIEGYTA